ncbi:MAG: GHKL domain-containing protein [Candidatus Omnitrophica bacterium]|nr:GHKL domain-containing protein [Candidatus Omnitrophota bacterium]
MHYWIYFVLTIGILGTLTLAFEAGGGPALGMATVVLGSLAYLALKIELARRQVGKLRELQTAYQQLDEQAKLIIRTDLELHRIQEELDKRLASLMSLHELGRQLAVSLRPEEIYSKLDIPTVASFGFEIGLLGMCHSSGSISWNSLVGIEQTLGEAVRDHLVQSGLLKQMMSATSPLTLQEGISTQPSQQRLLELLHATFAVVASIIPHTGPSGCLILGRSGGPAGNLRADEELLSILTNQLATAVENSALYEKAWTSQQELEHKVQERTSELAQVNTALMRLNQAKSDFVSAVSHELRTPLAAIKGYAALLLTGQFGSLSHPQEERIGKIEKHADLLTAFISNLLDIARIESGRITMEQRLIPIDDFLGSIQDVINPQMESKQIRYDVEHGNVTHLTGDTQHLQRVFVNLLSNAIKYTPPNGRIHLRFRQANGTLTASVSDTGCGISAEDLPKLFQEFYRANDPVNQQIRGTGLGLALVKRIIEAHHGTIQVASEKNKGSTFTLTLPTG